MTTIAWVNRTSGTVIDIAQYGDGISVAESPTSIPVEVDESNIPEIGSKYDAETDTFYPPAQP
jgi:hypothetical protein